MTRRWLHVWVNVFLAAFAADALLSLLDEAWILASGTRVLGPWRGLLATLVLWASCLWLGAMALLRGLPLRLLGGLALAAFWLNFGAMPLPLWLAPAHQGLGASLLQAAIAAAAFLAVRRGNQGAGWWVTPAWIRGPSFSLPYTLATLAAWVFVLLPAGFLYAMVSIASDLERVTARFVTFDLSGVSLADRRYARDGREVRLVGMVHIGTQSAYGELVQSFLGDSTVVLQEGVSDDLGLMEEPLSYRKAAQAMGLDPQDSIESYLQELSPNGEGRARWPVLRRADLDLSAFSPVTLALLSDMAKAWGSERPLLPLLQLAREFSKDPDAWPKVEKDLIHRRNEHLLATLEEATGQYERVIVPWGALHLPFIEAAIREQGFEKTEGTERALFSWRTVLGAVF